MLLTSMLNSKAIQVFLTAMLGATRDGSGTLPANLRLQLTICTTSVDADGLGSRVQRKN